jgi:glycosyltransferase involved in cell wall biosynthesis
MSEKKLISALCITYGRYFLLEEAIESFLRQDYPNKELIIVNDLPEQTLIFNHPQVKIFNFKERFPTIGDKRNKSVELSSGEILTSWDDDDVYLPWLLSRLVKEFELNPQLGFVQPDKSWCLSGDVLESTKGWCAHVAFTKKSFEAVNGYASINSGQDMNLVNKLKKYLSPKNRAKIVSFSKEEACYIFRWNNGAYHLSGFGRDKEGKVSGFDKIKQDVNSKPIEPIIELKPHWKKDYFKITRDYINNSTTTQ